MLTRREALALMAGASAGAVLLRGGVLEAMPQPAQSGAAWPKHKPVLVGGKRVRTVDVHAHVTLDEVTAFLKGTPLESVAGGVNLGPSYYASPPLTAGSERLQIMDKEGIDVQALSVNPFWYGAERDLATRLIDFQNQKLLEEHQPRTRRAFCWLWLGGLAIS